MLEAVIFDLDGVIVDSEPVHFKIEQELFGKLGIAVSEREHSSFVGTSGRWMWARLKEAHGLEQDPGELVELTHSIYLDHLRNHDQIHLLPGVLEFIKELQGKGLRLLIASSADKETIQVTVDKFNLHPFFEMLISGYEVKQSKPAPDIFIEAAKRGGITRERCIVIEDSQKGVTAAKSAGMICLGFKNPNSRGQDLSRADLQVDSFAELNYQDLIALWQSCAG